VARIARFPETERYQEPFGERPHFPPHPEILPKGAGPCSGDVCAVKYCLMQTELDRDRLLQLRMDPKKVITVGNIKFDRNADSWTQKEREHWLKMLGLSPECRSGWRAAPTKVKRTVLLEVFRDLKKAFPRLRLVIAPRDVARSREISIMALSGRGFTAALRTTVSKRADPYDVLVLDTVGELGRIYGLGHVAFVGGSFAPIGGHNLLEPAGFGIPVLFGPHTHNFELMSESILNDRRGVPGSNGVELMMP
jgi:3-deoxy-D-manno-octulosonic-acid transferase